MPTKARFVDVLSPEVVVQGENNICFGDILRFINQREYHLHGKSFTFSLFPDPVRNDYLEGLIITTQNSDIPPKRNIETGEFSRVDIDTRVEGFAYANVFLYDTVRNVFVIEINKNGCFPRQFLDSIYSLWINNEENEETRPQVSLHFRTFARRDEYNRMLRMNYYKKIVVELVNPQGLVNDMLADEGSIEEWIKVSVANAEGCNANSLRLEQVCASKRINPHGLSPQRIRNIVDAIIGRFNRANIKKLEVQGYTEDTEEPQRIRAIDLLVDSFNESFRINDIQVQSDLQSQERKAGIESLYNRILPEIIRILGR